MNSWLKLYEDLIGRSPTPTQISRMDRIRSILKLRDYDSFWYFVVVCDFYIHNIQAALKRFDGVRDEIIAAQGRSAFGWAALASGLRRPALMIPALGLLIITIAPALTIGTMLVRYDHHLDRVSTDLAEKNAEMTGRLADILPALAALNATFEQGIKVPDPDLRTLINALQRLPSEDAVRLASDPDVVRTFHVLATLSRDNRSSFVASSDPGSPVGARRQQALPWLSAQVIGGNVLASKLVAAYAANNTKLISFLRSLSDACGIVALDACR